MPAHSQWKLTNVQLGKEPRFFYVSPVAASLRAILQTSSRWSSPWTTSAPSRFVLPRYILNDNTENEFAQLALGTNFSNICTMRSKKIHTYVLLKQSQTLRPASTLVFIPPGQHDSRLSYCITPLTHTVPYCTIQYQWAVFMTGRTHVVLDIYKLIFWNNFLDQSKLYRLIRHMRPYIRNV